VSDVVGRRSPCARSTSANDERNPKRPATASNKMARRLILLPLRVNA